MATERLDIQVNKDWPELAKRESDLERCAGILLVTAQNQLIMQLRDDKPGVNFPGEVGAFGGGVEAGETPLEAAVREINEETNLGFTARDLRPFAVHKTHQYKHRNELIYCFFIAEDIRLDGLEIYEGQRPYIVTDPNDPLIVFNSRPVIAQWFKAYG